MVFIGREGKKNPLYDGGDNLLMPRGQCIVQREFALFLLLVAFLEFIDTACGIHQHILTRKEGVRSVGDFQFDKGVLVAVFPLDGLPGLGGGFAHESITIAHILEDNEPVTFGVDILFHNLFCLKVVRIWPYSLFFIEAAKLLICTRASK
jgi:hypothetical protein